MYLRNFLITNIWPHLKTTFSVLKQQKTIKKTPKKQNKTRQRNKTTPILLCNKKLLEQVTCLISHSMTWCLWTFKVLCCLSLPNLANFLVWTLVSRKKPLKCLLNVTNISIPCSWIFVVTWLRYKLIVSTGYRRLSFSLPISLLILGITLSSETSISL